LNSPTIPFWLDVVLRSLTPILVVGGWVVVYQLQALQSRRKLLREEAETMRQAVHDLHELAVEFHTEAYAAPRRLEVLRRMTELERRRTVLPQIARSKRVLGFSVSPLSSVAAAHIEPQLVVKLNQAITLEHFDDPTAEPLDAGSGQFQKIAQACSDMVAAIDNILIAALD
jgi:hypothetical protein